VDPEAVEHLLADDGARELGLAPRVEAPSTAGLLTDVVAFIRRYVVLTVEQGDAAALWVLHTHAMDAVETTPYLWIYSAEKESGKSRLLETLELLVCRPWLTGRVTAAALVRKTHRDHPTLLLDETDAAFNSGDEYAETLRGVLDCGYRRGLPYSCCVNRGARIEDFDTFGAKAIAGLQRVPDTIQGRAIPISLRRRIRHLEPLEPFRRREARALAAPIQRRVAAWSQTAIDTLRESRPSIPDALGDRAADCWDPLFALADIASGDWPQRARRAALALSAGQARENDSVGVRVLADIRGIYDRRGEARIASIDLVADLNTIEESPWPGWDKTGLRPHSLAKLLRPFGIMPGTVRPAEGKTAKGYKREDFGDSWLRYLPLEVSHPSQPASDAGVRDSPDPSQGGHVTDTESVQTPRQVCVVTAVTDSCPQRAEMRYDTPPDHPTAAPDRPEIEARPDETRLQTAQAPEASCPACGRARLWVSVHGLVRCGVCHPPADAVLVRVWWVRRASGRWLPIRPVHETRQWTIVSSDTDVAHALHDRLTHQRTRA
jgi:hypothetical protein